MLLNKEIVELICSLEYCIGSKCFNPNSYDGWTGDEGCEFRYPVNFRASKDDENITKTKLNVGYLYHDLDEDAIRTMKYIFGSNHLFIGLGILDILEKLENRYHLDFNELEERRAGKQLINNEKNNSLDKVSAKDSCVLMLQNEKKKAMKGGTIAGKTYPSINIESMMGGKTTVDEIMAKVPEGVDTVTVKPEENKIYFVKGKYSGSVDIW